MTEIMNTNEEPAKKIVSHTKTVGLRFPNSTCDTDEIQVFKMGYNTAIKSEFISSFVTCEEDEDVVADYQEVIIPSSLYRNIRYWDISKMIKLWKGESVYHGNCVDSYCYEDIARLTQSLLLDRKLIFVSTLEDEFPPNEVKPIIREKERLHNAQLDELQREITSLHDQLHTLLVQPLQTIPPPLTLEELM